MAFQPVEAGAADRTDAAENGRAIVPPNGQVARVTAVQLDQFEEALLGPAAALPPTGALPQPAPTVPVPSFGTRVGAVAKRVFDVVMAIVLILVALPIMLAVAVLVKLESPGPVFFRQRRLGRDMKSFSMLKFRTMAADASPSMHEQFIAELAGGRAAQRSLKKLVDDPRVTRVGRVIRKVSLDEVPQLFHVLSGHMSLVGPRPALDYEVEHYQPSHYDRFNVRPGLTGLWQVSGRAELGFFDMLELDAEYANSATLLTDLRILVLTPRAAVGNTA